MSFKKNGEKATNHRSVNPGPSIRLSNVQNGDSGRNCKINFNGSVGILNRYSGCLLPRPNELRVPQISGFQNRKLNCVFQFLPFGLSPAPWVFTRIIKPIKSRLHTLMILLSSYLDDFILFAESAVLLSDSAKTTLELLQCLGFTINWEKSSLIPAQEVGFLG